MMYIFSPSVPEILSANLGKSKHGRRTLASLAPSRNRSEQLAEAEAD